MFVIALSKINSIASVSDCLYHYRIRKNSLSHLTDKLELVRREDKLTWCMFGLLFRLFPDIEKDIVEKWVFDRKEKNLLLLQSNNELCLTYYSYPCINELIGKIIVIYGAVGKDYVKCLSCYEAISIVLLIDQNNAKYDYPWRQVSAVESIRNCKFDYIIAIKDKKLQENVKKTLVNDFCLEESRIKG